MAIRTSCPGCGKRFSAPEEYVGKRIECPRCRFRLVLRTQEEIAEEMRREEERLRRLEEDRRRLALIEQAARRSEVGRPYYERFQTGFARVRHYNPGAPSRFLRGRALSDWLLLAAWLSLFLSIAAIGCTIWIGFEGWLASPGAIGLALVGEALVGLVLFVLLKLFAELAFLFAELGDRQGEIVQLLLDIRENTDPAETHESNG
ncbi:MAG TPA: hypothetical protein VK116_15385 [Planctomycetota bacterium]|nr:hypothetical protein [Planctomycetota bacterium]